MLPEGWQHTKFGHVFGSSRTKGKAGLPTLSVTLTDGLVPRNSIERKMDTSLSAEEHLLVRKGDIAYNMMRMWQGASGLAQHDALVSPAYVVLRAKDEIDPLFAAYLFKLAHTVHQFWAYSYGITDDRLRLYFKDFGAIPVNLPPLLEQRRIAEILSTWDAAISAQERLIANAKRQKKALVQILLPTGSHPPKKRLPGFSGEWQTARLGTLADLFAGGTPPTNRPEYWGGLVPWMSSGEINLREIYEVEGRITDVGLKNSSAKMVPINSVLIALAGQGTTRGKVAISRIPLCTNQSVATIVPGPKLFADYLFHDLDARYDELRSMSLGDGGRGGLNLAVLRSVAIVVPTVEEQHAIASVLATADAEARWHETQLTTLRQEKSALMQQLLTGKRRVKLEGAVA